MAIRHIQDGCTVDVVIQPKASRNEIAGMHGDRVKIRLTAPPVDGKANAALITFLAKKLGIPKSAITIVRGETSRQKTLALYGVSPDVAQEILFTHR